MITFAPQFPATWLSETSAHSGNLLRLTCKLANVEKKNVIYLPRLVHIGKNCALSLDYGQTMSTVFPYTDLPAGK